MVLPQPVGLFILKAKAKISILLSCAHHAICVFGTGTNVDGFECAGECCGLSRFCVFLVVFEVLTLSAFQFPQPKIRFVLIQSFAI